MPRESFEAYLEEVNANLGNRPCSNEEVKKCEFWYRVCLSVPDAVSRVLERRWRDSINFETTPQVEVAVSDYFNQKGLITVPNVSWGFLRYEADILVLKRSGYVWEIEIKVSRADLLRDAKKQHGHYSPKVRELWFAIPEKLAPSIPDVPERAGVLIVQKDGQVRKERKANVNPDAQKLDIQQQFVLARLGALRIWPLKKKLLKMSEREV